LSVLLPELASVRLRETTDELVVEVDVPEEVELPRLSMRLREGRLEIRLPRVQQFSAGIVGFHPEASGV
jgi:hypothetical protein